jgi:hypothetical protein
MPALRERNGHAGLKRPGAKHAVVPTGPREGVGLWRKVLEAEAVVQLEAGLSRQRDLQQEPSLWVAYRDLEENGQRVAMRNVKSWRWFGFRLYELLDTWGASAYEDSGTL